MTGIPLTRMTTEDSLRLMQMEDELHKRVISQDEAIKAIARAVRRSRSGLQDPKRPTGCFIFAGPTGVGKTLLAKALAEFMFGDEEKMIRIDMSEYGEGTVAVAVGRGAAHNTRAIAEGDLDVGQRCAEFECKRPEVGVATCVS